MSQSHYNYIEYDIIYRGNLRGKNHCQQAQELVQCLKNQLEGSPKDEECKQHSVPHSHECVAPQRKRISVANRHRPLAFIPLPSTVPRFRVNLDVPRWVSGERRENTIICGHVDEPEGHHVKQNKLSTERQNSYGHTQ